MTSFVLQVQSYLTQKLGTERNECEDAVAFSLRNGAFAVSDGATEAFASRYWSRLLVRTWVRTPSASRKAPFLEMVNRLGERTTERWRNKKLPWYAEEKAKDGSFATFVGLTLECYDDKLRWRSLAIGDSCLVHERSGSLIGSFSISEPEQFGFRPVLLPSNVAGQSAVAESIAEHEGAVEEGDEFYLFSDSVANWYLQGKRTNADFVFEFEQLLARGSTSELDILFDEQRAASRMRNDDIAAIRVRVG